jgi:hypothetical protein
MESLSKRPVRRWPLQPIYAGQHGGKKMRLNMNCNNKILLLDEQQSSPQNKGDLNSLMLKQLQI